MQYIKTQKGSCSHTHEYIYTHMLYILYIVHSCILAWANTQTKREYDIIEDHLQEGNMEIKTFLIYCPLKTTSSVITPGIRKRPKNRDTCWLTGALDLFMLYTEKLLLRSKGSDYYYFQIVQDIYILICQGGHDGIPYIWNGWIFSNLHNATVMFPHEICLRNMKWALLNIKQGDCGLSKPHQPCPF